MRSVRSVKKRTKSVHWTSANQRKRAKAKGKKRVKQQQQLLNSVAEQAQKLGGKKSTLQQSFVALGLAYDANKALEEQMECEEVAIEKVGPMNKGKAVRTKEKKKKDKKRERMAQKDRDFCSKMLKKHGHDYEAMARDPANIYQLTALRLERKIDSFLKIQGDGDQAGQALDMPMEA